MFLCAFSHFSRLVGLAVLAGVLLYVYRNKKIIGIAQPFFLALVIFGSMVDATSILFMSRDNQDYADRQLDFACVAWPGKLRHV